MSHFVSLYFGFLGFFLGHAYLHGLRIIGLSAAYLLGHSDFKTAFAVSNLTLVQLSILHPDIPSIGALDMTGLRHHSNQKCIIKYSTLPPIVLNQYN